MNKTFRALLKKQLMENFSFIWRNQKKNTFRTGGKLTASIILYVLLFGGVAAMFAGIAEALCAPFVDAGFAWIYFAIFGLLSVMLGVFGSVFNTYASLYLPKDNDLLLALPIHPWHLLAARLSGVYALGLLYELIVFLPAILVYICTAPPTLPGILLPILMAIVLSLVILILSTLLGWVLAFITSKTKNKSLLSVALSLLFLTAYFYLYNKAFSSINSFTENPDLLGDLFQNKVRFIYWLGKGSVDSFGTFAVIAALVAGCTALLLWGMSKTYLKMLTVQTGTAKRIYKERASKAVSVGAALRRKEFRRFISSPTYMLNCGLGIVMMPISAVFLAVKGNTLMQTLYDMEFSKELTGMLLIAGISLLATMNDISAPSVSLEGKNIWMLQSFPLSAWQALKAKLQVHYLLTLLPMLPLIAVSIWILKPDDAWLSILMLLVPVLFALMMGALGLLLNLKMPNLTWTQEITPIKQGTPIFLCLFGGWILVAALSVLYAPLSGFLSPIAYLSILAIVLFGSTAGLLLWLQKKGSQIFASL